MKNNNILFIDDYFNVAQDTKADSIIVINNSLDIEKVKSLYGLSNDTHEIFTNMEWLTGVKRASLLEIFLGIGYTGIPIISSRTKDVSLGSFVDKNGLTCFELTALPVVAVATSKYIIPNLKMFLRSYAESEITKFYFKCGNYYFTKDLKFVAKDSSEISTLVMLSNI